MKKSIPNLFENENFVMGLIDMLLLLVLQVAKKMGICTLPLDKYLNPISFVFL
jgi:hypothetical protein